MNVSSVKQAVDLLEKAWSKHCGPFYAVAIDVCAKALNGDATAREARLAFVEAAKEIDAFVEEKTEATAAHRTAKDKVNVGAFSAEEAAERTEHGNRA